MPTNEERIASLVDVIKAMTSEVIDLHKRVAMLEVRVAASRLKPKKAKKTKLPKKYSTG